MFSELFTVATITFFIASLSNVILSTLKSVLTIKGTKLAAVLANCVSYTLYAYVIRFINSQNLPITLLVIFFSNLVGVYFALWILEKFEKDRLWRISIIISEEEKDAFMKELEEADIGYNFGKIHTKYGKNYSIDAFSESRENSRTIRNILEKYKSVKYNVMEVSNAL